MKQLSATGVAALCLALSASAQDTKPFTDPANLRGERVAPKTGRELPIDQGARGLEQSLRKLSTRASLMLIVAHPDDEDGGMLTLVSRGLGARVGTLTLTRGEGGQNAMTGDFEDALGLIRTQELLSADRYMGVDQMFGTEVDFGFSKTKEEAFAKWTHQRVLYDAVRAVRLYRPLVIAAVFVGGVTDGHGHHQVSGEIAQEVFKAAGDPKLFPELTAEGILPWQPLKVYARVPMQAITAQGLFDYATGQYTPARFTNYVTGETTTTPPPVNVLVHEGQTDPLLSAPGEPPRSYVQFARLGLGLQKTQIGPGVRLVAPGVFDIGYHRYGSRLHAEPAEEASFFEGIDTSLESIATLSTAPPAELTSGLRQLSEAVAQAHKQFDAAHPDALAPQLAAAQHGLGAMLYALEAASFQGKADVLHELRLKQVQLNEAIVQSLGLRLEATPAPAQADVPVGSTPVVRTELVSSSVQAVGVFSERLEAAHGQQVEHLLAVEAEPSLTAGKAFAQSLAPTAALFSTATRPYFFRTDIEQPVYALRDPSLRNAPSTPPALTVWATLRFHETEVSLGRVVTSEEQPVSVIPRVSLQLAHHAEVLPATQHSITVTAKAGLMGALEGTGALSVPVRWTAAPATQSLASEMPFTVHVPSTFERGADAITAHATVDGTRFSEGFRAVGYPGIPRTNFYTEARDKVVPIDLKLPSKRRVGYLAGTGDAVPEALTSVGMAVTPLGVADLVPARLAQFDTVVLGVRTYNAHPELHGAPTQALLAFAREGGNVILQYQTAEFTGEDAPFPLQLGSAEKVVDETAPVQLLEPQSPALASPNRLGKQDFRGWVEERGHGFLHSWDPRYTALTETHDPGQAPQEGGLITTVLGRGHWTYCAFALYRQLPEAVPGAFRLFVNLLGLGDADRR